jgi:peptide/nickel transport system substrate-binding protein
MQTKRLAVLLLLGSMAALLFAGGTTESPSPERSAVQTGGFGEAPMLAEMVASGKLPPVEDRLPAEPLVVEPLDGPGKYGGTFRVSAVDPDTSFDVYLGEPLFDWYYTIETSARKDEHNVARSYEFSEDGKTLTIAIRPGIRWSDGEPFTVDDIVFWYEAFLTDPTITPDFPATYVVDGQVMGLEKIDDYTFRLTFAAPYWLSILTFTDEMWLPEHFMSQYHIEYNPKANDLAREKGFDTWDKYFFSLNEPRRGRPTIGAMMLEERTPHESRLVRNPYYWKVDTAGNQLPYFDRVLHKMTGNPELITLMITSGELDYVGYHWTTPSNLPLYKQNEEQGNYRTLIYESTWGADVALAFNETYTPDPSLRPLFRDPDFRKAMSIAINRNEINELTMFGLGKPRAATVLPSSSYFEQRWADAWTEYDPDRANKMLDEVGLSRRDAEGWRMWQGKTLDVLIEYVQVEGPKREIIELVVQHWREVGIRADMKEYQKPKYDARTRAGEVMVSNWQLGVASEIAAWRLAGIWGWHWGFPHRLITYGHSYRKWWDTKGAEGDEPDDTGKRLMELHDEWKTVQFRSPRYMAIAKEIFDIHTEKLYMIATVGLGPIPILVNRDIGNFPETGPAGAAIGATRPYVPESWYFDK